MKLHSTLILLALATATSAAAEDYYVPIKKELEPFARLPMNNFAMTADKVSYTLPKDIVGRDLTIEATRDLTNGDALPHIYNGPLATLSCMGGEALPACVVNHRGLGVNANEVQAFLSQKYQDPAKLADALAVAKKFAESGNEPIGFISKRSPDVDKAFGNEWNLTFTRGAGFGNSALEYTAKIDFGANTLTGVSDAAKNAVVARTDDGAFHRSGLLRFAHETRWYDMALSTDKTVLNGTWGLVVDGRNQPAAGAIQATEAAR